MLSTEMPTPVLFVSRLNPELQIGNFLLEYMTDNIGFNGSDDRYSGEKNWLDAYWFGYNETVFTLSGPIFTPEIKFFGLFDYNFINDATSAIIYQA